MRPRTRSVTRALAGLSLAAMTVLAGGTALAHHVDDGGEDRAWTQAMNHPGYWEDEFGGQGLAVECTKYDRHGGFIPAGYDAAVVKDGQKVRVYRKPGPFQALGPYNDRSGKHFPAPHSWVMKCKVTELPPDTTVPDTTVPDTTVPDTTVPDTTVPDTTVPDTTVPDTTVPGTTVPDTTIPDTTTPDTTVPPDTTTPDTTVPDTTVPPDTTAPDTAPPGPDETAPPEVTDEPPTTPETLPYTGLGAEGAAAAAAAALLAGGGLLVLSRGREE